MRPDVVATTSRAAFKRRDIKLAASTTLSVIGWTRPARATPAMFRRGRGGGHRRAVQLATDQVQARRCEIQKTTMSRPQPAIRLIMVTDSTGY